MIKFQRRKRRSVPVLNTASLPDLIFTVLFFFMIVTHLRNESVKVNYQVPQGTELSRLTKKSAITNIYIGKRVGEKSPQANYYVQVGNEIVDISQISSYIRAIREDLPPEALPLATVSIKADRDVPMLIVTQVKQALRDAHAYRISYSAERKPTVK
ncbi:MAG: biopolymer transporter ExbD [Prevotella sp.]|nr:biopolymer transporter ExbD [Prevotella sp.]